MDDSVYQTLLSYATAQSSLERLEERRKLSPVRAAFRVRAQIAERQALARLDHMPLQEADVRVDGRGAVSTTAFDLSRSRQTVDTPITLDALIQDGLAVLEWLGVPPTHASALPYADPLEMQARVKAWQSDVAQFLPSPPLLGSAHMARLWRVHAPLGRGDLIASVLIGDRWGPGRWTGSSGGLIAMGLERIQRPWQRAHGEALEQFWLAAITQGTQLQLDLELRLRAFAARATQFIEARRRPGRLKDVLYLAMARPRITSGNVAKALGLTVAGAIKLLTIATEAGLLIERTGQASYRSYAIPVAAPSDIMLRMHDDPLSSDDAPFPWSDGDTEESL
jgi:hypothetical protein